MLQCGMGNATKGPPANPERYIVENLYWNSGRWKPRERCTERDLEDSKHMTNSDMKAMIDSLQAWSSCDLSQIPLQKQGTPKLYTEIHARAGRICIEKLEQSALGMAKAYERVSEMSIQRS